MRTGDPTASSCLGSGRRRRSATLSVCCAGHCHRRWGRRRHSRRSTRRPPRSGREYGATTGRTSTLRRRPAGPTAHRRRRDVLRRGGGSADRHARGRRSGLRGASTLPALEPADWLGAVIGLVRSRAGAPARPGDLVACIDACPEIDGEVGPDDASFLESAFDSVLRCWEAAGVVDANRRLTALGAWACHAPWRGPGTTTSTTTIRSNRTCRKTRRAVGLTQAALLARGAS